MEISFSLLARPIEEDLGKRFTQRARREQRPQRRRVTEKTGHREEGRMAVWRATVPKVHVRKFTEA